MTKEQAEKIDEILKILVKYDSTDTILATDVAKKVRISNEEMELLCKFLTYEILYDENIVIKSSYRQKLGFTGRPNPSTPKFSDLVINSNYNTQNFLYAGGCVKYYNDIQKRLAKEKRKQELEQKKLENDVKSFNLTKTQFYFTIGAAIFGSLTSFILLLNEIFNFF